MTATLMAPTDPMTEDEFDDFRTCLDAGFYGDPDDDDDEDGGLDHTPYPAPYDDDRRRGRNDAVRCPCPTLAPYPPAGWLSLTAWDTLDAFATLDGCRFDEGESRLWVPLVPTRADFWLMLTDVAVPLAAMWETVLERGCWIDLTTLGA